MPSASSDGTPRRPVSRADTRAFTRSSPGWRSLATATSRLFAEAAPPCGVRADRPQEVHLAEVRPVGLAEVELRVRALPQQEARQPLLARGADDEVRVGLALGVEVLGDVLDVEELRQVLDGRALRRVLLQ